MEESPPGFRFSPTEEELVSFYLERKLDGIDDGEFNRIIPVVDIYQFDPWYLPEHAGELCQRDPEQWFFFTPRQETETRGGRTNRITTSGYWKATGSPGTVYSNNRIIGIKRTMVFYQGRAPSGTKTRWKMIEYKVVHGEATPSSNTTANPVQPDEFRLCRVYVNSGCLRAFDRRPGPTRTAPSGHDEGSVASTCHTPSSLGSISPTNAPHQSESGDDDDLKMEWMNMFICGIENNYSGSSEHSSV